MESFDQSKLIIRPAAIADVSDIIRVTRTAWLATYPNEDAGITKQDIQAAMDAMPHDEEITRFSSDFIENVDQRKYIAAEYEGKVIGYCRVTLNPGFYELRAIYILPDFQQKGIGKKLYQKATEGLDPMKSIILFVAPYNTRAVRFYESLGFKKEDKEIEGFHLLSGKSIPEIQMTKSYE